MQLMSFAIFAAYEFTFLLPKTRPSSWGCRWVKYMSSLFTVLSKRKLLWFVQNKKVEN